MSLVILHFAAYLRLATRVYHGGAVLFTRRGLHMLRHLPRMGRSVKRTLELQVQRLFGILGMGNFLRFLLERLLLSSLSA